MGRSEAKKLVSKACQLAVSQERHLIDVVREMTTAPINWEFVREEKNYFGSSDIFINQIIQQAMDLTHGTKTTNHS